MKSPAESKFTHSLVDLVVDDILLCPRCLYNYSHRQPGLIDIPSDNPKEFTSLVAFKGECGHQFGLQITQYKGQTFLYVVDISND